MNHFFKGLAGALSTVGAYLVYLLGGWDAALTVMFVLMGLIGIAGILLNNSILGKHNGKGPPKQYTRNQRNRARLVSRRPVPLCVRVYL